MTRPVVRRAAGRPARRHMVPIAWVPIDWVPIALVFAVTATITGCAGSNRPATLVTVVSSTPASPTTVGSAAADPALPPGAGTPPVAAGDPIPALPAGWSLVASARGNRLPVSGSPGGPPVTTLSNPTADGSPLTFRALDSAGGWLHVQLPIRPNGSTGWVDRDRVDLSMTPYRLVVHRSAHRLEVRRAGQPTATYPVGIGKSITPTPGGTYYLTELLAVPDPHGPYGPYAFGLSAFSPTLTSFAGGPGQLGLHGTNQPDLVGSDVSHGCLRVTNDVITRLAGELPLGTPIEIGP